MDDDVETQVMGTTKVPKWVYRIVASVILGIVLMVALKPKMAVKTEYDPTRSVCQLKTRWSKAFVYGCIAAIPLYFVIKKFY